MLGSAIQFVSGNRAKQSLHQTTIRSALERFIPSCPVIGFGRPYLVVVVHGAIVKVAVFLMSKAAEAVGVKGICSVPSVGRDT